MHMSLASALDSGWRLTTACGGSVLTAYAIRPAIASYLSEAGATPMLRLALFTCGALNVGVIVVIVVLRSRLSPAG